MPQAKVRSTPKCLYRGITAQHVLEAGEVQIWQSPNDVEQASYERLRQLLSPDEIRRADAFRFQRHRKQYVIGRGLLRMLLASYLQLEASELRFRYSAKGKPELLLSGRSVNLQFNVAHSGAIILLAFTLDRKIGVDIEEIRTDIEIDEISQRFFSPREREWLASLPVPPRCAAFFRCWTRKEALLKATGEGLSVSLDSFDVFSTADADTYSLETADGQKWLLQDMNVEPGYAAALALGYADV